MIIVGDPAVGKWVCAKTGGTFDEGCQAIGWRTSDGCLAAGVIYDQYNGRSICMHVASDGGRQWLHKEFLAYAFYYPFCQLGVNRIIGLVDSDNKDALNFDKALGFEVECVIKDAGKTGSLVILSMPKDGCKWLKLGARYPWCQKHLL